MKAGEGWTDKNRVTVEKGGEFRKWEGLRQEAPSCATHGTLAEVRGVGMKVINHQSGQSWGVRAPRRAPFIILESFEDRLN